MSGFLKRWLREWGMHFGTSFLNAFYLERMVEELCPWPYFNRITSQITFQLPWHGSAPLNGSPPNKSFISYVFPATSVVLVS